MFFPPRFGDFAVSYGLSVAILNMTCFLLFTTRLLIITIQGGEKALGYQHESCGFHIQTLNSYKQHNLLCSIKYIYTMLLLA